MEAALALECDGVVAEIAQALPTPVLASTERGAVPAAGGQKELEDPAGWAGGVAVPAWLDWVGLAAVLCAVGWAAVRWRGGASLAARLRALLRVVRRRQFLL